MCVCVCMKHLIHTHANTHTHTGGQGLRAHHAAQRGVALARSRVRRVGVQRFQAHRFGAAEWHKRRLELRECLVRVREKLLRVCKTSLCALSVPKDILAHVPHDYLVNQKRLLWAALATLFILPSAACFDQHIRHTPIHDISGMSGTRSVRSRRRAEWLADMLVRCFTASRSFA